MSAIISCGVVAYSETGSERISNNEVSSDFCMLDTYGMVIPFNHLCSHFVTVYNSAHITICFHCYYILLLIFCRTQYLYVYFNSVKLTGYV